MRTLDVENLISGIEQTITDIKGLRTQVEPIQRAVRDFHSLDDDLHGKGGTAMRAFYQDTHEPFLIYLHQALIDYENILTEMKEAIDTFESKASGYISQAFIESEVVDGFDKVETKAIELTDDANSIIGSVDDLVTIPKIDESKVVDDVQDGKEKANQIVEELTILDEFEATQLEQAKDTIQTMRTFLTDMESRFKSGELSIVGYDVNSIADSMAYNTIKDEIYNKKEADVGENHLYHFEDKPLYEIEKAKDEAMQYLDSDSEERVENAYIDLENGDINRNEFHAILIGEKQQSIEWEGESETAGYEVDELWQLNYMLNKYKIDQLDATRLNDTEAEKTAIEQEDKLRKEYAHLADYLIDENDIPHDVPKEDFTLPNGEGFDYRVDNDGYLHYKAEQGYIYSEESHKQTKTQRIHGIIGRAGAIAYLTKGYSLGSSGTSAAAWLTRAKTVGGSSATSVASELLNEYRVPGVYIAQTNEVKTMIYREDKETGNMEHLIIDSIDDKFVNYTDWRDY